MAAGSYVPTVPGRPAGSAPRAVNAGNNKPKGGSPGKYVPGPGPTAGGSGTSAAPGTGTGTGTGTGYNSALYDPSATLTGKPLAQAATAIADAQTTGPISELAAQIAQNNRQGQAAQKETLGYYLQLAQAAKDAVAKDQTLGAGLNTALQGVAGQTQTQLGQLGQQATGGALGRMSALGLDAGQTQAMQSETARQQGVGSLNAQTFRNAGLAQNANYAENANNNRGIDALAGTEGITKLGQATRFANQPLNAKIAALDASKGALTATALGQLRTAERNYQIAEQGIGSKNAALRLTAAQDAARNALTAAGIKGANRRAALAQAGANSRTAATQAGENARNAATIAGEGARNAESIAGRAALADARAAAKAAAAGHPKLLPQSEQNTLWKTLDSALAHIPILKANGIKNAKGQILTANPNQAQVSQVLEANGFSSTIVDAAYELRQQGYVTSATAKELKAMGLLLTGGHYKGLPIKVGPANTISGNGPPLVPPGTYVAGASGPK